MNFDAYTRFYLWLVERRRWVLLGAALLAGVSIVVSLRMDLEEDILGTLPERDTLVDDYKYAFRKFRQIDRVFLDVGIATDDPDRLAEAADTVHAGLAANPVFERIMYRFEIGGQQKTVGFLTGALPNLFTDADAALLESRLAPTEVGQFLAVMRRKLAGPEGMVLKDVLAADPIGMSALVLAKVLPLQSGFGDAQIVDGRIVSNDGRHVLLLAEPGFPSSNSGQSMELVADLLRLARGVESEFPGVHVAITGGHRMAVDNATLIKGDATRCIFLGMGAMLALCLIAFRRRWLAAVAFLPSLFGTLVACVVLALWWKHVSAIATGFATIAIGITVDYAIYVIYHLDNAAGLDRQAVGRHVSRLVLPITLGSLTTVAAFVVMAFSPMHGYQQLGVFGAVGVVFSAAFALIVLPLLVPIPKETGQPPLWLTRSLEKFFAWRTRRLPWLLLGVVVLSLASVIGLGRLRFEGDISKLNGITESTRHDEEVIRKTWGDTLGMTLVVARGTNVQAALWHNDRIAEVLAREPNVEATYSLASVCPSQMTQAANLRRWHQFWTPARRDTLRQTLQRTGAELGFRADAFAVFWRSIEGEPTLLTLDNFLGTPLEQALKERVALGTNDVAVSTLLKLKDRSRVERLQAALPGTIVLDQQYIAEHIASLARVGLGDFALWTGVVVALLVYFSMASIELVFAVLLPVAFGVLWTFGVMGWLGLPVDIMNSVFVIFLIGISEDYSVFLVASKLDEWRGRTQHLAATSASVLISALTTIFGFAVLIFARHPVLFSMGTTVLIGMVCTFAATVILSLLFTDLLLFHDPPRGAPRAWHLVGTVWAAVHLGASEIFLFYLLRPVLKLVSPRTADDKLRRATRWLARGVVKGLPFGKLEFQNITPATFSPPCIVISNHQSAVDVMLMVALPADVRQTAKKRVFDTPILGIGCKLLGHIMIEPNDPQTSLRRCQEKLAEGACVHFYCEGTRSFDGFMQRFHRGAFELAVNLKQDILPIVLCDTRTAMPRDSYWFEPYYVTVRALRRITPQSFDYSRGGSALMRHCEGLVRAALQRQLDELNSPRVVRRKVERLYRYLGKFIEQYIHWKLMLDPVFHVLDEVVPREGFILDLGCGYGEATNWLASFTDQRTALGVDYDAEKIRVARRSAPNHPRVRFEEADLLQWDLPVCDTVLLLDVLHYWTPEKQLLILEKARHALRPGGTLILREAARAGSEAHRRVHFWELIATRIGHNRTVEGLHFLTLPEIEATLRRAGFAKWELKPEAGRDSNLLLVVQTSGPSGSVG